MQWLSNDNQKILYIFDIIDYKEQFYYKVSQN